MSWGPTWMHEALLRRFRAGDRAALARVISLLEDRGEGHTALLQALYPSAGTASVIGITGAPGVGKSSLVAALADHLRDDAAIAILAVDPSSPMTGGAILGDRVRMPAANTDERIYVRSMSARGQRGGLAVATGVVLTALDAFGFDRIIIETVGAGQSEVDIVKSADTTVVVTQPTSGDDIQLMKAGIVEIADIFVLNKADLPGAETAMLDLEALAQQRGGSDRWTPPVCETVATAPRGLGGLEEAIATHAAWLHRDRAAVDGARRRTIATVGWIIAAELAKTEAVCTERLRGDPDLIDAIHAGDRDPYSTARMLLEGQES